MGISMLKGKRIAAIDFGLKRVGLAVCDELHIVVSPRKVLDYTSPNFWNELKIFFEEERIGGVVVGVPVRSDGKETEMLAYLNRFINRLKSELRVPIYEYDESFSTVRAVNLMVEVGKKKQQRQRKENKDLISAAIILRDFIEENHL